MRQDYVYAAWIATAHEISRGACMHNEPPGPKEHPLECHISTMVYAPISSGRIHSPNVLLSRRDCMRDRANDFRLAGRLITADRPGFGDLFGTLVAPLHKGFEYPVKTVIGCQYASSARKEHDRWSAGCSPHSQRASRDSNRVQQPCRATRLANSGGDGLRQQDTHPF
jgi:hypothetical protein